MDSASSFSGMSPTERISASQGMTLFRARNRVHARVHARNLATALRRASPMTRVTVLLVCSGISKSQRHWLTFRLSPLGVGFRFVHANDLRAFEREPPRHDEADIPAAEDNATHSRQFAEDVGVILRGARREYARAMAALHADLPRGALSATRREDEGSRANTLDTFARDHGEDVVLLIAVYFAHKGERPNRNIRLRQLLDESLRILRAGELFSKAHESEAIVNALLQNSAEARFPLDEQRLCAFAIRGERGCKSGRAPRR